MPKDDLLPLSLHKNPKVRAAAEKYPVGIFIKLQAMVSAGKTDEEIAKEIPQIEPEKLKDLIASEQLRELSPDKQENVDIYDQRRKKWLRAMAIQARHLALCGMDLADKSYRLGDALGFASSGRAVLSFHHIESTSEELMKTKNTELTGFGGGVNVFFLSSAPLAVQTTQAPKVLERRVIELENVTEKDRPS